MQTGQFPLTGVYLFLECFFIFGVEVINYKNTPFGLINREMRHFAVINRETRLLRLIIVQLTLNNLKMHD